MTLLNLIYGNRENMSPMQSKEGRIPVREQG